MTRWQRKPESEIVFLIQSREVIAFLYSVLVNPCLKYCAQFCVLYHKKDMKLLKHVQGRATKPVEGSEKTYE